MPTSTPKSPKAEFRQDLLFRLNTIEIRLPPLRDRREDIPLLAAHFLRQHAEHYRKNLTGFDEAGHQSAAGARLAGQRARAGPRRGARRPDGAGRQRSAPPTSACAPAARVRRAWKK